MSKAGEEELRTGKSRNRRIEPRTFTAIHSLELATSEDASLVAPDIIPEDCARCTQSVELGGPRDRPRGGRGIRLTDGGEKCRRTNMVRTPRHDRRRPDPPPEVPADNEHEPDEESKQEIGGGAGGIDVEADIAMWDARKVWKLTPLVCIPPWTDGTTDFKMVVGLHRSVETALQCSCACRLVRFRSGP